MASAQVSSSISSDEITDKRYVRGSAAGSLTTPANYASITALRARLAAISGATFTTARLDAMTVNDMVYAVRVNDDLAGI